MGSYYYSSSSSSGSSSSGSGRGSGSSSSSDGDPRRPELRLHAEDHERFFRSSMGQGRAKFGFSETFFGDPQITNEPLHSVAVVLNIINLSSQFGKDEKRYWRF